MLTMAGACLALPVFLFSNGFHHGFAAILLAAFGLVMGGTIIWSLIPRRDKFEEPGPTIDLSKQPKLRSEIADIAALMGEELPATVYLTPDANAFVAERGGFLSIGNRRVMGLGLPLLQTLNVSQFRAVLAHEFAHFYGGDTRLAPWVYNARNGMLRVFQNLDRSSPVMNILRRFAIVAVAYLVVVKILVWLWRIFLRLTQFVSRKQEFRSDELACHVAGSEALIGGLKVVNQSEPAVVPFWRSVVWPIVQNGRQPKIADGFAQFLVTPHVAEAAAAHLEKEIKKMEADPFDTHPSLAARIERAKALGIACDGEVDERPATCLMDDLEALELALLHDLAPDLAAKELKPMDWAALGTEFYLPVWREEVLPFSAYLSQYKLTDIPALLRQLKPIAAQLKDPPGLLLTAEQREGRAAGVVESALTLTLIDHGWSLDAKPGFPSLTQGEMRVEPENAILRLRKKEWTAEEWVKYCGQLGVGSLPLVKVDESGSAT